MVIRCDNGTGFKNREMNQFCKRKSIKREFSVARTPQQNRVAERKNRTLIEAARTMLADSNLLTTFWAEVVNTACYVQNRVLVTKPHNKTPYELFHGRKPALGFMRPFGCPFTILNTIDHLGKFDGKAGEGFFIGYSINSKAFRVFNSRTRIVEEIVFGHVNEDARFVKRCGYFFLNESSRSQELLQAPIEGVGDVIVVPLVLANQFELQIGLLNLVAAISFHGFENDDPQSHIKRFTKITQTIKLNQVPHDIIKLILFMFSLEGAAQTWLEKEPPNSITTWNNLVSKFVNQFFPPSRTTNLQNDITHFQQKFGETFNEAWERLKDLLKKCPHHRFSPLPQIDTFYNGLNQSDQDSLNSAAGGNLLTRNTQEALTIIENKSKVRTSRKIPPVSGSSSQNDAITTLTKQVKAI
ncbi:reverse transcriptase domain-containing protein [Tanacetum coccineum]